MMLTAATSHANHFEGEEKYRQDQNVQHDGDIQAGRDKKGTNAHQRENRAATRILVGTVNPFIFIHSGNKPNVRVFK